MPEKVRVMGQKVELWQPEDGFRTALDSMMLAAACPAQAEDHILDLGCGVGGAGFCVLARVPETHLTGVDIQDAYIAMARDNIALNKMEGRADFVHADIQDFQTDRRFDHIIINPPYIDSHGYYPSNNAGRTTAHAHQALSLKDWLDVAVRHLKSNGTLTIVHRADAVDKIILGLKNRFGATEIIPLWPHAGEKAKRVIVRTIKDRKTPATIHAGIVLHQSNGDYTEEADAILRGERAIFDTER